jgi:uncharacterized protein (TIGR04255 family)
MANRYSKPPVVEALCEFRFIPSRPWDHTFPGLVFRELEGSFPVSRPATGLELVIQPGPEGTTQRFTPVERSVFSSEDGRSRIQVAPNNLVVNRLRPYAGWNAFRPSIDVALGAYVSQVRPEGIARVGLRYINRFEIPESKPDPERLFRFYPHVCEDHVGAFDSFIVGIRLPYENSRDALKVQLTTAETVKEGRSGFVLDLDYSLEKAGSIRSDNALEWLDAAHGRIEDAFEGCLTDEIRSRFEGNQAC